MKRIISLFLALVLVVGTFAGCGKSNKKDEPPITATAVIFNKSGKYTTTVSSKKVDLSGITADNVEVRYIDPNTKAENTESAEESSTEADVNEDTSAVDKEIPIEKFYTLSAKVEDIKAADKKSYEITFTDDKASEYITDGYVVLFKGVDGADNIANVSVEFPEITLAPDVESVVSDAKQAKISLEIGGSEFEDSISEKDIYLDNAFSDMKIESVSSSSKNLTVLLKGTPVRNEAGAYQWGSINVMPSGIKDGYADVTSKIDIQISSVYIDAATLKFDNGKISVDLKVYGTVDINSLTKDNIKLDGATVEAAEKTDDNTVKLTISADGIKSANDFADKFSNKSITVGEHKTDVSVSQASFYPVFDYVEEDGNNFKITLKLYANGGTFDQALKADAISFADDFENAKAESATVESDTLATLILSVPANGQTTETMKYNGTVNLAAGSLTNAWGEKTSDESSYNRDFSAETLGRDMDAAPAANAAVSLNPETLLEIQKYTRGLNTTFGKICYYGQIAGSVFSISKSILEATGIIESEHAEEMRVLKEINTKMDKLLDEIQGLKFEIQETKKQNIQTQLQNYNKDVCALAKKVDQVNKVLALAKEDMAEENPEYANIDWDNLSDEDSAQYCHALYEFIDEKVNHIDPVTHQIKVESNYSKYKTYCEDLQSLFESICEDLQINDDTNPIMLYDEYCSLTYNFDSQAYAGRLAQRTYVQAVLTEALATLALTFDTFGDGKKANYVEINYKSLTEDFYSKAITKLETFDDIGCSPEEIKAESNYKVGQGTEMVLNEDASAYYPYCYVLGSKVAFENSKTSSSKTFYADYGPINTSSGKRDWTDNEWQEFVYRLNNASLKQNLKSAGIDTDLGLLITSKRQEKNSTQVVRKMAYTTRKYINYDEYSGKVITNDSYNVSDKTLAYYEVGSNWKKDLEKTNYVDALTIRLV